MLIVLSPAKALDMSPPATPVRTTTPALLDQAAELLDVCQDLSVSDLKRLMKLSDNLAQLNHARFQDMNLKADSKPAVLAFAGDVYKGLEANSLTADQLEAAQARVRILSGLYGVLRPLDALQPYRLEMGTRLATSRGQTLYDFWGTRIAQQLDKDLADHPDGTLVNCASTEYFKAVDRKALKAPVVTCHFKEEAAGTLRVLGLYAKTARGMMARFALEQGIQKADDLKAFDGGGYRFQADLSNNENWVFTRPKP